MTVSVCMCALMHLSMYLLCLKAVDISLYKCVCGHVREHAMRVLPKVVHIVHIDKEIFFFFFYQRAR